MKASKDRYFIAAAFLAAFGFFALAYPYHLMRREQLTLFLYDIPYIIRTYGGVGFVSRFLGDFLEQFFCIGAVGPVVVSLLLTVTGWLSYGISRKFAGKKLSFLIAFLVYVWSFLRETETIYVTQYTIAIAGFLLCVYAAVSFKKPVARICALPAFLLTGALLFGCPYHKDYGKLIGKPDFEYEKLIAMDVEASRENWDKVLDISQSHLLYNEACYLHNLAAAMKGELAERIFTHPQNFANGLFLTVYEVTPFSNGAAGEVWYHLGNMTLADQSAMVSIQFSPKHSGARYVKRLAMINLISGEYGAAEKYLKMLSKSLMYHKWACGMMPSHQNAETSAYLESRRTDLVRTDIVSSSNDYRHLLRELLDANPGNRMAKEYLLCYDLLSCDLESFMEDYTPGEDNSRLYQEAALVWLNIKYGNNPDADVNLESYGIKEETVSRLMSFYRYPERYKNTYWYYYTSVFDE